MLEDCHHFFGSKFFVNWSLSGVMSNINFTGISRKTLTFEIYFRKLWKTKKKSQYRQWSTGGKIPAGAGEHIFSRGRGRGIDSGRGWRFLVKIWSPVRPAEAGT